MTDQTTHATGPRTAEGKAISRLNSLKHGLTGESALVPGEDPQEYEQHLDGFLDTFEPASPVEMHLALAIAADYWRARRLRHLECAHIAEAIENCTEPDEKRLNLYSLYESRINRNIRNNMAELRRLQADRQKAEREAFEEILERPSRLPREFVFSNTLRTAPIVPPQAPVTAPIDKECPPEPAFSIETRHGEQQAA